MIKGRVVRISSLVAFFLLWEVISRLGVVNPLLLPAPSSVVIALFALVKSGELMVHTSASLYRAFFGFLIAAIIAIPHGILMAWFRFFDDVSSPIIELFRPIPIAALIPVSILWFGIGNESKIAIIAFGCYFPILLNTISGVRNVDVALIKVARLFNANRRQTLSKIVLPSSLPSIMTGLRISIAFSLILLVITEMIGANSGLGFMILDAEYAFQTEKMFAGIFIIGFIGLILNEFTVRIERRLTRWKREITSVTF
ncbi:MAG: ABC transporter permease [Candidatus Hydrothermarchaeales archaeon]